MEVRRSVGSALILIPGSVNFLYNQCGRRIGEVLTDLGIEVSLATLPNCPRREYDYCFISNISEVVLNDEAAGIQEIRSLRGHCKTIVSCGIDSVQTHWFARLLDLSRQAGADFILDLGLHDQSGFLDLPARSMYRFAFSGLTASESRWLDSPQEIGVKRPIPWAFIGHSTALRAGLVDYLVQHVSANGFVYLPRLAPYAEKGSPHLNQQQLEAVLRRTQYQVWCSHHSHFYLEPERFRVSLLTGGVPIKVVESRKHLPRSIPFRYFLLEAGDLSGKLREGMFTSMRSGFQQEWRSLPLLTDELARILGLQCSALPELIRRTA
jgi:hypothetical protein